MKRLIAIILLFALTHLCSVAYANNCHVWGSPELASKLDDNQLRPGVNTLKDALKVKEFFIKNGFKDIDIVRIDKNDRIGFRKLHLGKYAIVTCSD